MPKASPLQESFLAGELSPFVQGRVSSDQYKQGLDRCLNYLPLLQGALTRRPGTYFVCEVKDSTKETVVRRFEFSTQQAYIIEFGDLYVRFLRDHGQIVESALTITGITQANPGVVTSNAHGLSTGEEVVIESVVGMTQLNGRNFKVGTTATNTFQLLEMDGSNLNTTGYTAYSSGGTAKRVYTVTTPYTEDDVRDLTFVQSADVLYIVHPSYAPRKLSRLADTNWTLSVINFLDGPYLPIDTSGTTLTPSSSTSTSFNITASAALFASTDVGRLIRLSPDGGTTWFWMKISGFTDSTHVAVTRTSTGAIGTTALATWRFGIWSDTTGYPGAIAFHEDRLCLSGAPANPQRLDMSVSSDYENFAPTDSDSTVNDDNAVSRTLAADDVNYVYWMKSAERGLLIGASGGEWVISPAVTSEAISPSNIQARRISSYGSANMQPVQAGKSALFVQATSKTIREMSYFFEEDGYLAPDRTLLADHITGKTGLLEIAYQKEKPSIVWGVRRTDGIVMGMTYARESDALVVSCHRHIFGGVSDAGGSDSLAKSVACIPSPDGFRTEAYFVVERLIDGRTVKTIEYLTPLFEYEDEQRDAFFVDCGLTYDAPLEIEAATQANPVQLTITAHGLADGDKILASDVLGMTELNGMTFTVRNPAANTFTLEDVSGNAVDGTAFNAYALGGEVRKYVTTIAGLWHLEGQTVDIFADGGVQPPKTVSNGAITLQDRATTVSVGLAYLSQGKRLRDEAGAADGTALGKERRIHRVAFSLFRTLGLKIGTDFDNLQPIIFRTNDDPDGRAPSLFTGVKSETIECDYSFDSQVCWEQRDPFPGAILAVGPQLETQDRG